MYYEDLHKFEVKIGKGKSEDSDEEQGEAAQVMEDEEDEPSKGRLKVMWH
jgi:hypothetical protein